MRILFSSMLWYSVKDGNVIAGLFIKDILWIFDILLLTGKIILQWMTKFHKIFKNVYISTITYYNNRWIRYMCVIHNILCILYSWIWIIYKQNNKNSLWKRDRFLFIIKINLSWNYLRYKKFTFNKYIFMVCFLSFSAYAQSIRYNLILNSKYNSKLRMESGHRSYRL